MDTPSNQHARNPYRVNFAHVDSGDARLKGVPEPVPSFVVGEGA
ncbi:MAG: hypothetical protein O7A71_04810 [Chloroflexi bacterium]|nr:hypothetical protein [Chloroflexota bacterium]